jgi:hypothetical protein
VPVGRPPLGPVLAAFQRIGSQRVLVKTLGAA